MFVGDKNLRSKKNEFEETIKSFLITSGIKSETDELRKMNALVRFYYKIDPSTLTDDEFAKIWGELRFALEFDDFRKTPK